MPIYMKIDGFKGPESDPDFRDSKYLDCFEIDAVKNGIPRSKSGTTDQERETNAPTITENIIWKPTDSTSTNLFRSALSNGGKKVWIAFVKIISDRNVVLLEITLSDTTVSSYIISGRSDTPTDAITLKFTKVVLNIWTRARPLIF
jgi:type VI protein secretion system component Hcp